MTLSKRSSSSPHCAGYLFPDPLVVKAGKVTGILNHSERGPVYLSGEVTADGAFTAKGAGNSVEGMITGKLFKAGGNGTWKETSRTYCDGKWSAVRK